MILGSWDDRHDFFGSLSVFGRKNRGVKIKTIKKSCFFPIFSKNDQNLTDLKKLLFPFFCNKSQKQLLKTFLKRIKTTFGLSLHHLTHNLCFLGSYVKIRIFCENQHFFWDLNK